MPVALALGAWLVTRPGLVRCDRLLGGVALVGAGFVLGATAWALAVLYR